MGNYPHTLLSGSGLCVGLPEGQMGNSEVGHLNMGAGRVVHQDFTRIDKAIEDGDFFTNPVLIDAIKLAIKTLKKHCIFLVYCPPVECIVMKNIYMPFLKWRQNNKSQNVYIHAFLDGRDTPPRSAMPSIKALDTHCNN